jgi:hypothetical protein
MITEVWTALALPSFHPLRRLVPSTWVLPLSAPPKVTSLQQRCATNRIQRTHKNSSSCYGENQGATISTFTAGTGSPLGAFQKIVKGIKSAFCTVVINSN